MLEHTPMCAGMSELSSQPEPIIAASDVLGVVVVVLACHSPGISADVASVHDMSLCCGGLQQSVWQPCCFLLLRTPAFFSFERT